MSLSYASLEIEKVSISSSDIQKKELLLNFGGDQCVDRERAEEKYPEAVDPSSPFASELADVLHFISCAQKEAYQFFGDQMGPIRTSSEGANVQLGANNNFSPEKEDETDENGSNETTVMNSSEWSRASSNHEKKMNEPPYKKLKSL